MSELREGLMTRYLRRARVALLILAAAVAIVVLASIMLTRQPAPVLLPMGGDAVPYWEAIAEDDRLGRPTDLGCIGECDEDNPATINLPLPTALPLNP